MEKRKGREKREERQGRTGRASLRVARSTSLVRSRAGRPGPSAATSRFRKPPPPIHSSSPLPPRLQPLLWSPSRSSSLLLSSLVFLSPFFILFSHRTVIFFLFLSLPSTPSFLSSTHLFQFSFMAFLFLSLYSFSLAHPFIHSSSLPSILSSFLPSFLPTYTFLPTFLPFYSLSSLLPFLCKPSNSRWRGRTRPHDPNRITWRGG